MAELHLGIRLDKTGRRLTAVGLLWKKGPATAGRDFRLELRSFDLGAVLVPVRLTRLTKRSEKGTCWRVGLGFSAVLERARVARSWSSSSAPTVATASWAFNPELTRTSFGTTGNSTAACLPARSTRRLEGCRDVNARAVHGHDERATCSPASAASEFCMSLTEFKGRWLPPHA